MRISIIQEDNIVVLDGRAIVIDSLGKILNDADIHAIQWDTDRGHIEYKKETKVNEKITSMSFIQPVVDEWTRLQVIEDAPPPPPTPPTRSERISSALADTEARAQIARNLEDLIETLDNAINNLPKSVTDWAEDRKTKRANASKG